MDNRILEAIRQGNVKREEKLPGRTKKIERLRQYYGCKIPELITESVARDRSTFVVTMKENIQQDLKRAIAEEFPNCQVRSEVALQDGHSMIRRVEYSW
jgi:phage baseplate assembly protein W